MSEHRPLHSSQDVSNLWEVCNNFENPLQIVTMHQHADPDGDDFPGGELTICISGEGLPMVEIVFHGVICWKFDNAPIIALEVGVCDSLYRARFWHDHSSEDEKLKTATTSWVLSRRVEWRCVKDQSE